MKEMEKERGKRKEDEGARKQTTKEIN